MNCIEGFPNRKLEKNISLIMIEERGMWKGSGERLVSKICSVKCKIKGNFATEHIMRLSYKCCVQYPLQCEVGTLSL